MSRRLIFILTGIFFVIILALGIILRPQPAPVPISTAIVYTDAVTGLNATDIVQQTGELDPFSVNRATATIDGIDKLYNTLTTDQASNVQDILDNFLMAHSGLQTVQAGIQDDLINSPDDNTFEFTLVTTSPQLSYLVEIHVNNQYQTIPDVTISEAQ